MGVASFFGLLLVGCSPLATVFLFSIAPASFLVLLTLGSAFFWLVTLFVISSLFRAWAPLEPEPGPYVGLLLVAVLIQELARVGVWRFHRMSMRVLNRIAQEQHDAPLGVADRFSLALSYGFSHGAAHSAFFFLSWLPLSLDSGTIYNPRCPRLSYFTVGALSTLGMGAVLTGGMVLFFDALDRRRPLTALLAPATHAAAALLTLVNFTQGGCLVSVPLLLAGGAGMAAAAGRVWWLRTTSVPRLAALRRPSSGSSSQRAAGGGAAAGPEGDASGRGNADMSGPAIGTSSSTMALPWAVPRDGAAGHAQLHST